MAKQDINLWFKKFDAQFNELVPVIVSETATEFFKGKFTTQEWEGVAWQPLNPNYAARKTAGRGRILTKNAFLVNSIRPSVVTAKRVVISAGNQFVPYARIHNEGLRVAGVQKIRPFVNRNFMGKGKAVNIKAHTRTVNFKMPKRQFMGNSKTLNENLRARLVAAYNAR